MFPRKTQATPVDGLAFVDCGPGLMPPEVDQVHISVAWTYDIPRAEQLAKEWQYVAPVRIGGPATGMRGESVVPGMYVRDGYAITSRGCPNRCWFCSVWKREGNVVRELPIADGWNVLDDNLLACSESHIRSVFAMLARQKRRAELTGGLEAARLQAWHVELLRGLKPAQFFFAYDTPDDYEPLIRAGRMLDDAGFPLCSHARRCYVLIGWPKDTFESAEKRLWDTMRAGFLPMAMLWRNAQGDRDPQWMRFQRLHARPAVMSRKFATARGLKAETEHDTGPQLTLQEPA